MNALKDEFGKPSSTRWAGAVFVALLVAVVTSHVWFAKPVADIVYTTLETLILVTVAGVTLRGAAKSIWSTKEG